MRSDGTTERKPPLDRIAAWLASGAMPPCPHPEFSHDMSGMCRLCAAVKAECMKAEAASEVFAEPA